MKSKEKIIIEEAVKLFSRKGFSTTSIQEIAKASGISKGAFYLHFKSKDALFLSIITSYIDEIQTEIDAISAQELPPKDKFTLQLITIFKKILNNKEFILMQSKEQIIPLNEEVRKVLHRIHLNQILFYCNSYLSIYGEEARPYLWDLANITEGLFHAFIKLIILDEKNYSVEELIYFVLAQIDIMAKNMINEGKQPILNKKRIDAFVNLVNSQNKNNKLVEAIADLETTVGGIENNEDLIVSLQVIQDELMKAIPRLPVIRGMLANFRFFPECEVNVNNIEVLLKEMRSTE